MALFVDNRPLLEAYRAGESSALGAVYDAYVDLVVDVLRFGFQFDSRGRTLRFRGFLDPLELETFTQEIFTRVFSEKARSGYDGYRPFKHYLTRIAKNCVIDELRRRRRDLERWVGALEGDPAADESAPEPEELLDAARAQELVRDFVESEGELEQRLVRLRFVEDQSLLAAARTLNITRMRARVLEAGILRRLERTLRKRGYLEGVPPKMVLAMVLA